MKKILIFTDAFSGGGAEEVMRTFSLGLEKEFEIKHISKWNGPKKIEYSQNMQSLNYKSSFMCIFKLYSITRKFKPDIFFSSTVHNNIVIGLLRLLFFHNISVVYRESSIPSKMNYFSLKDKIIDFLFVKFFYKKADIIISQSNDMTKDLVKNYGIKRSNIHLVNNPLISIEKHKSNNKGNTRLISVGRFSKEKGFERLLLILKKLPKNFNLRILGDGKDFLKIKSLAKTMGVDNRVRFLGYVNNKIKIKELLDSDIYLQTSYVEGFPNSLLESVSVGLPAIAFDVKGGTKEIINNLNGILIADNSIEDFVESIKNFNAKKYVPKKMQADIIKRFSKSEIIFSITKIFNSI